jgi:PAS domain S-box-containing protein
MEEDFSQIFSMSIDLICIADIQTGAFIKVNPAFIEILGFSGEELVQKSVFDFIHPDDIDSTRSVIEEKLQMGAKVINFENRFRCKDGGYRWLSWVSNPVREKGITYSVARDVTDHKETEERIESQNRLMSTLLDNLQVGVFMAESPTGKPLLANKQAMKLLGRGIMNDADKTTLAEVYQAFKAGTDELYPQDEMPLVRGLMGENHSIDDMVVVQPDGTQVHLQVFGTPVRDSEGKVIASLVSFSDITDRKRAEEEHKKLQNQLLQSQKMESVGRLAGGVAHDFNNILSIIIGNAELLLEDINPDSPLVASIQEIHRAAERSANLTRQLLAFARKQPIAPEVINLNETLEKMLVILERLIGEAVDLIWLPRKPLRPVKIDPSQIDQILANLCINARDAIRGVGKVMIETDNVTLDEAYCKEHAGFHPGDYVMIAVSDNGSGMDKETLDNLFEPFFTTKHVGKGSGLGLATVYGIVKQNNGFINVYSEPGEGTTFKIYLPQYNEITASEKGGHSAASGKVRTGHETILLVEDEEAILTMTKKMLERLGYTVLGATTPSEAIRMVKESGVSKIHLLMTDVVMPEMNGRELSNELMGLCPDLKYLFMSGYTENVIAHHDVLDNGVHFINKPFSIQSLSAKVREALDKV